ncbi:hypothetical protein RM531_08620 [Salinisphaera sp. P385]|uniref:DUF1845 domain-containing protein n=1 Tax=Spectribacter acetivorans TaxID=3075603 RepID=A0ABU3B8Z5_9GAMM|nr:hypothetical protein [Salinisphaera sp. P385]MDT0618540.1 hypothetical protein [Salinisphaera sp. P385]
MTEATTTDATQVPTTPPLTGANDTPSAEPPKKSAANGKASKTNGAAKTNGAVTPETSTHRGNSRAIMTKDITFGSTPAQKLFGRHNGVVSSNLYQLGVMLPIRTTIEVADRVEGVINEYLTKVEEDLQAQIDRMEELMASHNIQDTPTYTSSETYHCEITTPHQARFLRLISLLDRLVLFIDALWLEGVFNNKQRNSAIYDNNRRVARLAGRIRNLANSAKSVLNKGKDATPDDVDASARQSETASDNDDGDEAPASA